MDHENASKVLEALQTLRSSVAEGNGPDGELRTKLKDAVRATHLALESETDMTTRVLVQKPVEELTVRLAADLNIYHAVATASAEQHALSFEHVVSKADNDSAKSLRSRLLRALLAFGSLEQNDEGSLVVAPSAMMLSDPAFASLFGKRQDFLNAAYKALPSLLAADDYRVPVDPTHTALQRAFSMNGKSIFDVLQTQPETGNAFGQLMNTWGAHGSLLHEVYDVEEMLADGFDPSISDVMLVDVGGGWGQKSIAVKRALPHLLGRFISQDLPHVILAAPPSDLCEITAHDFFTTQPIKYDACVQILQRLHEAMRPEYTKLLLHEQVVPQQSPSTWTVTQDFNMMTLLATSERTEAQWRDTVARSGLQVVTVYFARDRASESVIEIVRTP
ncbi:MAG: hypothetical protein Q9159_005763 [Coniocarpon cinnabarinum]